MPVCRQPYAKAGRGHENGTGFTGADRIFYDHQSAVYNHAGHCCPQYF